MRVHEIAVRHVGDGGGVRTVGDVADFLLLPAMPDDLEVGPADEATVETADVVVAEVDGGDEVSRVVELLPEGGRAVLVTASEPDQLQVGQLISAVLGAGGQVVEAWALHHGRVRSAVVVVRAVEVLAPSAYLSPAHADGSPADAATLRRLVAEWVLVDFVARAREALLEGKVATLTASSDEMLATLAATRDELTAAKKELADARGREAAQARRADSLQRSTSMRVGRVLTAPGRRLARRRRRRDEGTAGGR